ncbi:MAG TPA: DUF3795 domain-containing protein [Thermoleophilia bacterium]|jgi:Protein of unknown function (DUF3795)
MTPFESKTDPSQIPPAAAVCGLFCEACAAFIASQEDPKRLSFLAARMGQTEEDTYCEGCRSESRSKYCRSCTLFACATERGHAFCGECTEYPCPEFESFRQERPHRAEIARDMERIGAAGAQAWVAQARERYMCPECRTINSAYDLKCRTCGHDPSTPFVAEHREAIAERLSRQ